MFKVLLVDDEILTREAISKNVPWEDQGFYLIGAAENGQDAINQIQKEQPDLVITDICMPYMDGLELSSYIYQNYPDTKVVILSGHDEFEYARHALEYRVKEYILKPVTSLELKEVLRKVKISLEEDTRKKAHYEKIQSEYKKNIPVLRERLLRRLIEEKYTKKDIYEQLNNLNISIKGQYYTVALINLEDASQFCMIYPDSEEDLIHFTIANITNEIMEESMNGLAVSLSHNRMALLFAAEDESELETRVYDTCQQIMKALWDYVKIKVSFSIGITVNVPYGWKDSYLNAKEVTEYKFLKENQDFVFGRDLQEMKHMNGHIAVNHWSDRLELLIKLNQGPELEAAILELFDEIKIKCSLKKDIILYVQNIFLSIIIALEEAEEDQAAQFNDERASMKRLAECNYLSELKYDFIKLCSGLMNKITGQKDGEGRRLSILAMDYIEKNYMDSDMSLNMVCTYLGVSISYFSMNFKNYTGETFVEALTRIRIEKAKKLMDTTDLRTYEIAEKVGYNDPHYFSMIFKKVTGMTPSEYAKGVR